MRDTDLQTSKCRRCEGTHYGSVHCPFLGEVPCVSCGRMIHEEAGADPAIHPYRRFDALGRVYHASCEQDVAPKKEPTFVDRLRRHAHDLTHGGTNASELRQDLETAAERILAADAYYADTVKPEPAALRACAEAPTPIRAHVLGCPKNFSVPVDRCDCGGRDFVPDQTACAEARPSTDKGWQSISTAPKDDVALFWVVPKTPEEAYCNTSGDPIFGTFPPYIFMGKSRTWSSLSKATHWLPLPAPPRAEALAPADQKTEETNVLTVVVNGQPVEVNSGSVPVVIQQAILKSGQIGAPIEQWELRTRDGDVIPHDLDPEWALTGGRLLFLNLGLPKLRAEALAPHPQTVDTKEDTRGGSQ